MSLRIEPMVVTSAVLLLVCVSGAQALDMAWVTVGDPGNVDDSHGDGYGGVSYKRFKEDRQTSLWPGFVAGLMF